MLKKDGRPRTKARLVASLCLALGIAFAPAAAMAQEKDASTTTPETAVGKSGQVLATPDGEVGTTYPGVPDSPVQLLKAHEDAVDTKATKVADEIWQSVEAHTGGDFDKWDLLRATFHTIADTSTLDGYGLNTDQATLSALDGGKTTLQGATTAFRMLLAKLEITYEEYIYTMDGVEHLLTAIEIDGVWADIDIAQDIRERVESGDSEATEDEWTLEGEYGEPEDESWEDVEWDLEDEEPLDPSRYSSWPQNYIWPNLPYCSPVRTQGRLGWCSIFANIAAVEASVLRNDPDALGVGYYNRDNIHLSERHLAYFLANDRWDPLGNFTGYILRHNEGDYIRHGGNSRFASNTLMGWAGPADDSVAPTSVAIDGFYDDLPKNQTKYAQFLRDVSVDRADINNDAVHVSGSRRRNMDDRNAVKRMIMEDGAVVVGMYINTSAHYSFLTPWSSSYYYDGSNKGVYDKGKLLERNNHEVVIVGWDDNFGTDHFNEAVRPSAPGAWLVRNSWGPDWGVDGYFWISYEDKFVNTKNNYAVSYKVEAADTSDYLYQYDGSNYISFYRYYSGAKMANVFCANQWGQGEILDAVSFYEMEPPTDYEVYIYTDIQDPTNPESGTPALAEPVRGTTDAEGHFKVYLPEGIYLKANTTFSVVIRMSKKDNKLVKLAVTGGYQRDSVWTHNQDVEGMQGKSFIKEAGKDTYFDTCSLTHTPNDRWPLRIKAQTSRAKDIDIAGAEIDEIEDQTYTGEAIEPMPVVTYKGEELVEGRDFEVFYRDNVAVGTATVLVSGKGAFTGVLERTFEIVRATGTVEAYDVALAYGTGVNIVAKATPETAKLTYTSSDESVVTVTADGALTSKGVGTAKVAVTADWGNEYERATTEVRVIVTKGEVRIDARSLTLVAGVATTIKYEATAGAGAVSYTSSDPSVATVDAHGTVTPVRAGTSTITVRCAETELFEAAETTVLVTVTEAAPSGGQGGHTPYTPWVPSVPAKPTTPARPAPSWSVPATSYKPGTCRPGYAYGTTRPNYGFYPYATRTTSYGIAQIISAGPAFGTRVVQMPSTRTSALPVSVERAQTRVTRTVGWWNAPQAGSWTERTTSPYLRLSQLRYQRLMR